MSGSLIDGGIGASAYFWLAIWVLTLLPMAVVLAGLTCQGIGGVLSIVSALWPATHRSQRDVEAARSSRTLLEGLMEALESECLPYELDAGRCLSVSVPTDDGGSQSVQLAGSTVFAPILSIESGSRPADAISILAAPAGFDVAVVGRNGRYELGVCAMVPVSSRPRDVVNLVKRIAQRTASSISQQSVR
jgi:hypothetical protein